MTPLLFAILTASISLFFWYIVLYRSQRKGLLFFFWFVFFIAMIFGYFWKIYAEDYVLEYVDVFLGIFLSFVLVGGLIEYGKNIIVRFFGRNFFHTLDDVVDLSFATALGFTTIENILFFYEMYSQGIGFNTPVFLIKEVISQSFFILPVHLFCSGIFGYYYGMSLFAKPEFRKSWGKLYSSIQILKGTLLSTFVYGLFFFIEAKDFRVNDFALLFGYQDFPITEQLFPMIAFIFSTLSALFLFQKMEQFPFYTETKEEREKREEKEAKE